VEAKAVRLMLPMASKAVASATRETTVRAVTLKTENRTSFSNRLFNCEQYLICVQF